MSNLKTSHSKYVRWATDGVDTALMYYNLNSK